MLSCRSRSRIKTKERALKQSRCKAHRQENNQLMNASAAVALSTPSFGSKTSQGKKAAPKRKITAEKTKGQNDRVEKGTVGDDKDNNETPTGQEDGAPKNSKDREASDPDEADDDPDSSAGLTVKGNAKVRKQQQDLLSENEITISVSYTGGGQGLKSREYTNFHFVSSSSSSSSSS